MNSERQYPLVAIREFEYTELPTGQAVNAIQLPHGATVISGAVYVDQVSNAATSDVLAVGDAGSANRYLAAGDLKAAAAKPLVPTGYKTTGKSNITVTRTENGVASQGKYRLVVQYIQANRGDENEG